MASLMVLVALGSLSIGVGDTPVDIKISSTPLVPQSVEKVESIGSWSEGQTWGEFRLIMFEQANDHIITRIRVEWRSSGINGGNKDTIASKTFDELGLPQFSTACWSVYRNTLNDLQLKLAAQLPDGGKRAWLIAFGGPNVFKLKTDKVWRCRKMSEGVR